MPINKDLINPIISADGEAWPHTYFLKNCIDQANVEIGDYSYYNDFSDHISNMRQRLAPYLHEHAPEKLIIGKFVQIAHGTQIITSSANHQMDGFSTYPFAVFGEPWSTGYDVEWPYKGDNIIHDDVWLGHQSLIMPGVTIGHGAIVASRAVVTKDVPAFAIVVGNPARVVRMRFSDDIIKKLLDIAWWNWPVDKITKNLNAIVGADIEKLT